MPRKRSSAVRFTVGLVSEPPIKRHRSSQVRQVKTASSDGRASHSQLQSSAQVSDESPQISLRWKEPVLESPQRSSRSLRSELPTRSSAITGTVVPTDQPASVSRRTEPSKPMPMSKGPLEENYTSGQGNLESSGPPSISKQPMPTPRKLRDGVNTELDEENARPNVEAQNSSPIDVDKGVNHSGLKQRSVINSENDLNLASSLSIPRKRDYQSRKEHTLIAPKPPLESQQSEHLRTERPAGTVRRSSQPSNNNSMLESDNVSARFSGTAPHLVRVSSRPQPLKVPDPIPSDPSVSVERSVESTTVSHQEAVEPGDISFMPISKDTTTEISDEHLGPISSPGASSFSRHTRLDYEPSDPVVAPLSEPNSTAVLEMIGNTKRARSTEALGMPLTGFSRRLPDSIAPPEWVEYLRPVEPAAPTPYPERRLAQLLVWSVNRRIARIADKIRDGRPSAAQLQALETLRTFGSQLMEGSLEPTWTRVRRPPLRLQPPAPNRTNHEHALQLAKMREIADQLESENREWISDLRNWQRGSGSQTSPECEPVHVPPNDVSNRDRIVNVLSNVFDLPQAVTKLDDINSGGAGALAAARELPRLNTAHLIRAYQRVEES